MGLNGNDTKQRPRKYYSKTGMQRALLLSKADSCLY